MYIIGDVMKNICFICYKSVQEFDYEFNFFIIQIGKKRMGKEMWSFVKYLIS